MLKFVKFGQELVGKGISAVLSHNYDEGAIIVFTDGTYTRFQCIAEDGEPTDFESRQLFQYGNGTYSGYPVPSLLKAGVISDEDVLEYLEKEKKDYEAAEARQTEYERAEFQRLRAKFEPQVPSVQQIVKE